MKHNSLRKYLLPVLIVFLIIGIGFSIYVLRVLHIKKNGIILTPSQDISPTIASWYLQNDASWSNNTIGNTAIRLGSQGCLISSAATAINQFGIDEITPATLNEDLTAIQGFEGANLIWYKVNEIYPSITYEYSRIFSSKTIEKYLKNGQYPIVLVHYFQTGITHWVLIVGAENGDFLIADPLRSDGELIPLSTHGKVYAFRVFIPA